MRIPIIWAGLLFSVVSVTAALGPGLSASVDAQARQLKIVQGEKRLLLYTYGTNQYKPYVKELATLEGVNVLLDAPPDHLHHHGLMYAIAVNGINFWEETPTAGIQKAGDQIALDKREDGGACVFTQTIYWLAPSHRHHPSPESVALLRESRQISLFVNPAQEEVAVRWQSDFTTGSATNKYVLSGSGYFGLGLRPITSFNMVATRLNPGGLPYTAEAKWDVLGGQWGALIGKAGPGETTITMFNHDENRAKPIYFSMLNPFAYLSATQGLDKQTIEYPANAKFSVRYLVTVHKGARTVEFLNQRGKAPW